MKRRRLLIFLILAVVLFLCCCTKDDSASTPTPDDEDDTVNTTDDDYLAITPRKVGALKTYTLVFEGSAISTPLPESWCFEEMENGGYRITREGEVIGRAESGYVEESGWRTVATDLYDMENGTLLYTAIEKSEGESVPVFRHRLQFTTESAEYLAATFFVPYGEIDQITFNAIYREAEVVLPQNYPCHDLLWEHPKPSNVLILGNSFIYSSQIGTSLQELFDMASIDTEVVAVSRGYAHVSTYVADSMTMQQIRDGAYDVVFICGLYGKAEVESLKMLRDVCKESDTPLVLFPAHNEPKDAIDLAVDQVEGIYYLPWREEVAAFIAAGVSEWDMCVNDTHKHSTHLAGYVGAHMIYRAVMGASPDPHGDLSLLTKADLEEKLGRVYLETGMLCEDNKILFFS